MAGDRSRSAAESPPPARLALLRGGGRVALALLITLALLPVELAFRLAGGSADRKIAAIWSRALLACLGLELKREGTPIRSGMLAANHASWIDPLAVGAAAPAFFVAKREVRGWPVIGPICRLGRVEFVERRPSAVRSQVRRLSRRLDDSHLLCVFPEGTSTDGLRVLRFRSSLFASVLGAGGSGVDTEVQPVVVRYRSDASLPESFYAWWGDMTFAQHLLSVAALSRRGRVTVTFLDPVSASSFPDRKSLAREVEARVVREFGAAEGDGATQG